MTNEDPPAASAQEAECFVIMPITVREDVLDRYGGNERHFTDVYKHLLSPAIKGAGLVPKSPVREGSENIQAAIINDLVNAALVLVDMSTLNANVFFELGIRTALNKPVCMVWDGFEPLPFDTGTINSHKYDPSPRFALNAEISSLQDFIESTRSNSDDGTNALWKYFGTAIGPLASAKIDPDYNSSDAKLDVLLRRVSALAAQYPGGYTNPSAAYRPERFEASVIRILKDVLRQYNRGIVSVGVAPSPEGPDGGWLFQPVVTGPPPFHERDGFDEDELLSSLNRRVFEDVGANVHVKLAFEEPF